MNKLPSSSISNKSPYELLYSKTPTLDHLKVIGCLCYDTVMPKGDKFSERAAPTIFLGYSELQKGYVLLDIKSKKFLLSRDVIFHENIFPFSRKEVYAQASTDICGSPLDVVDNSLTDCDLEVTKDTKVHDDNAENANGNADTGALYDENEVVTIDHDDCTISVPIATEIVEVPTTSVRRTSRSVKQPVWIKDYTKGKQSSTRHPIANSLSYDRVTSCYKAFVSKFSECIEPKHFHQAVKDDRLIQAM